MKSSTVMVGYGVSVTNIIKVHAVMTKPLRGQSNQMGLKHSITCAIKFNYFKLNLNFENVLLRTI